MTSADVVAGTRCVSQPVVRAASSPGRCGRGARGHRIMAGSPREARMIGLGWNRIGSPYPALRRAAQPMRERVAAARKLVEAIRASLPARDASGARHRRPPAASAAAQARPAPAQPCPTRGRMPLPAHAACACLARLCSVPGRCKRTLQTLTARARRRRRSCGRRWSRATRCARWLARRARCASARPSWSRWRPRSRSWTPSMCARPACAPRARPELQAVWCCV